MPKINIYVPDDLQRRMKKVKDLTWSQVACEAFERKLGELAAQKQEKDMQDVIQRLRASKLESSSRKAAEARKAGYNWAKDHATAEELRRLDKHMAADHGGRGPFEIPPGNDLAAATLFAHKMSGRKMVEMNYREVVELWESILGPAEHELPDEEFVQAFAKGAVQLWDEVGDRL